MCSCCDVMLICVMLMCALVSLDLPSIVWKGLIHDTLTEQDVLAIDRLSFKMIEQLKSVEATVSVEVRPAQSASDE